METTAVNSPRLNLDDLYCPCGKCPKVLPSLELRNVLEKLLFASLAKLYITSAFRCAEHNKAVGGALMSKHTLLGGGCAADIACTDPIQRWHLIFFAMKFGAKCIEVCEKHIHIDLRPGPFILLWGKDH